jgi:hypothetical protein
LPDSDLNTIQSSCYEAIYEYVLGCNSTSIKEKFKVDCVVDALNNDQKIELIKAADQVADLIHISGVPPLKAVEEAIKSNQIKRVLI